MIHPRISRLAISSFLLGIVALPLFVAAPFLALPAIFVGAFALHKINKHPIQLGGKGFALAGLWLGAASVMLLVTACGFNSLLGGQDEKKNAATCMMNLRQLGVGTMAFGASNMGRLPGSRTQFPGALFATAMGVNVPVDGPGKQLETAGVDPASGQLIPVRPENVWMADWLAGMDTNLANHSPADESARKGFYSQPTRGTIYPYVNTAKAYLCPSQTTQTWGAGSGSNGQFDYSMLQTVNGSRVDRIARTASLKSSAGSVITTSTPVIVEEDPASGINKGPAIDGTFFGQDALVLPHKNGTNIMTLDGSVYWFQPLSGATVRAAEVFLKSTAPANAERDGSTNTTPFGWFNYN